MTDTPNAPAADAPGTGGAGQTGDQGATSAGNGPAGTPPTPGAGDQDSAATIARLERELASARAEAGKSRVNAKETAASEARQQLMTDFAKMLGVDAKGDGDKAPDPQDIADKLAADARDARVELAIYQDAPGLGADARELADSRGFLESVSSLDPSADDFRAKLSAAIKKAVEANPRLKADGQAPPRIGAQLPGGSGDSAKKTRPTLSGAVAAKLGAK